MGLIHLIPPPSIEAAAPPVGEVNIIQNSAITLASGHPVPVSLPVGTQAGATVCIMATGQLNNQWPGSVAGSGTWSEVVQIYNPGTLSRPVWLWKGLSVGAGETSWTVTLNNTNVSTLYWTVWELTAGADTLAVGTGNFNSNGTTHSKDPNGSISIPADSVALGAMRTSGNTNGFTPQAISGATRTDLNESGTGQHEHSGIDFTTAAPGETVDTVIVTARTSNAILACFTDGGT